MKTRSRILTIMFMIIILTNNVASFVRATTCKIGNDVSLTGYGSVECHVRNSENGDYPITTDLVGYYDNGIFYPAYCLNRGVNGADNSFTQTVNVTEILANDELYNKIWRVVRAGYPYHTAAELGVDDWTYAYQATKMAIYDVLGQTDVNNYYGIDEIGERTVALMKRLVNEGENGTSTYKTPVATINKSGDMKLVGDEYIQNYTVTSNVGISSFSVSIAGVPSDTTITDSSGNIKNKFNNGELFQIRVPKYKIENSSFWGTINVDVQTKSYPIFYGKTYNSNLQNYAITASSINLTNANMSVTNNAATASVKIRKVDKDTNEPISGVTYEILHGITGEVIATGTTDEEGNLIFSDLFQGDYIIKEVKTDDNYIVLQETINVKAVYNKVTEIVLTNEHKKGNLRVYKVDKDNNNIVLGGVEFELYSEEFDKVIGTYTTNENGEIYIENLRTGKYKLHEIATNKWYNLAEDTEVFIKWNETTNITIENELKKGKIKIVKIDKDNQKIKLKGVKFDVLDKDENILETITTDENGEAYTKEYALRDYQNIILKEKGTLENYTLNDTPQTIELQANQVITITLANEKKKGQIKVIKIDKDNKEIKLEGVKFEVYDEDNNLIQTLITNKNGEAITERLPIDKEYIIKEIETNENYVLNEEIIKVKLRENEVRDLVLKNEKKKGQIKVIKIDSENNEIYIPDVTFEIYNGKGEVVDTITTNSDGKATSKRLAIDEEYTIKETISNKAYVLNEEITTVVLKENEVKELTFENTKKYGRLKINKVSSKYSKILDLPENSPLANTKFLVVNEKGESMGIYITDETGSVLTEKLPYGEYTVYEYETPEHFLKDANPQTISITEDKQTIEMTFKNTPTEPELPKTGF